MFNDVRIQIKHNAFKWYEHILENITGEKGLSNKHIVSEEWCLFCFGIIIMNTNSPNNWS